MLARIYQPARTAMQSGQALTKNWILEFEPEEQRFIDPLMGWTGSGDMKSQIRLWFTTKDEAIAYADRHGIAWQLFEPRRRQVRPKAYADNFRHDRKIAWTH